MKTHHGGGGKRRSRAGVGPRPTLRQRDLVRVLVRSARYATPKAQSEAGSCERCLWKERPRYRNCESFPNTLRKTWFLVRTLRDALQMERRTVTPREGFFFFS